MSVVPSALILKPGVEANSVHSVEEQVWFISRAFADTAVKGMKLFFIQNEIFFSMSVLMGGVYHVCMCTYVIIIVIIIIIIYVCLQTYPHKAPCNEWYNLELVFKDRCNHSRKGKALLLRISDCILDT